MMQPDSQTEEVSVENSFGNSDVMNFDMMVEIERELLDNPYDMNDMISLVFLLYDNPDTAFQCLTEFQRVSNDATSSPNPNMLQEWWWHAKHNPNWKQEFVEALLICQLHSIVKKLGINVPATRRFYQTDSITVTMFVNPMKKALYKLCESINSDNLLQLKKALLKFNIDTMEYDSCELVFLKLMCDKFITINAYQYNKKVLGFEVDVEELIKIVKDLPGLRQLVLEIDMLQESMNNVLKTGITVTVTTPSKHLKVDKSQQEKPNQNDNKMGSEDNLKLDSLQLNENMAHESFKSNRKQMNIKNYEIKSNEKVGTCVIINQVKFYPSKDSIDLSDRNILLNERIGSEKDVIALEDTMRSLKFMVISETDLDHKKMKEFIMDVVKNKVTEVDSIFMLCILSHGVRGHVYAADSVKVKMDDIYNMLDSDAAVNIHKIPKVLVVQACRENEDQPTSPPPPNPVLVGDIQKDSFADVLKDGYSSKKKNFITLYATAPGLQAYRYMKPIEGSVFIQELCLKICEFAKSEHIYDIFTEVNNDITTMCEKFGYAQVAELCSTLTKNLYLHPLKI